MNKNTICKFWVKGVFAVISISMFPSCDSSHTSISDAGDGVVVNPLDVQKDYFTDKRDGEKYKTVTIGEQTWMAQNLRYNYKGSTASSYCYNDENSNCEKYGRLYTWSEDMANSICPSGWHLPDNEDWKTLISSTGGIEIAGRKLKAKSTWNHNGKGSDSYSFTIEAAGFSDPDRKYNQLGDYASFWSATRYDDTNVLYWSFYSDNDYAIRDFENRENAFSVRCIKGEKTFYYSSIRSSSSAKSSSSVARSSSSFKSSSSVASSSSSFKSNSSVMSSSAISSSSIVLSSSSALKLSSSSSVLSSSSSAKSSSSTAKSSSSSKTISSSSAKISSSSTKSSSSIQSSSSLTTLPPSDAKYNPEAVVHGTLKDLRDNQEYKTVSINNITWMAENLRYDVPVNDADTVNIYCPPDADTLTQTGCYYTWKAAQDACPDGWELPVFKDVIALIDTLSWTSPWGILETICNTDFPYDPSYTGHDLYGLNVTRTGMYAATSNQLNFSFKADYWTPLRDKQGLGGVIAFSFREDKFTTNTFSKVSNYYPVRCIKR